MAEYPVKRVFFDNAQRYAPDSEHQTITIIDSDKVFRLQKLGYIGDAIPEKRKGRKVKYARVTN